jgi:hypothetical protein
VSEEVSVMVRNDSERSVSVSPAALAMKETALETAALIGRVANASENEQAVIAMKQLAEVAKLTEKARKAVKEPVLQFGKEIDAVAKEFVAEIRDEEGRLARLVADFQALEAAKIRAAEALRLKDLADLERRRQEELAQAKSHDELDSVNKRFNDEAKEAAVAAPVVAPARATGQVVREDWDIVVSDIWTLARAHPGCVEIKPRLSEIRQLLDAGAKVAGVTANKITKVSVRSVGARALDVAAVA